MAPKRTVTTQTIWYVASTLLTFLGFRFVLALLGANPVNPVAGSIYGVSGPFAVPLSGLFGYHLAYGTSQLDVVTLIAIATYAGAAGALHATCQSYTRIGPPRRFLPHFANSRYPHLSTLIDVNFFGESKEGDV